MKSLIETDRRAVWHPFTQMQSWSKDPDPLMIESGEGAWLTDIQGRKYLDGVASLWVQVHGHRCEEIDEAVRSQLAQLALSDLQVDVMPTLGEPGVKTPGA